MEPPRLEPPRLEPPRLEPPRLEPPRLEPPRLEPPRYVCVLDLDETCGFSTGTTFHVRPKFETFLHFLGLLRADVILWSLGSDSHVVHTVNGFLPELARVAFKIFGRTECDYSQRHYRYPKASPHVRDLYASPVFLIGIDDKVAENMDEHYDLRIHVKPYTKVNSCDKEWLNVIETLIEGLATLTKQS